MLQAPDLEVQDSSGALPHFCTPPDPGCLQRTAGISATRHGWHLQGSQLSLTGLPLLSNILMPAFLICLQTRGQDCARIGCTQKQLRSMIPSVLLMLPS